MMVIFLNTLAMLALSTIGVCLVISLNRFSPAGSKPYWIGAIAFIFFARVLEPVFLGVAGFALPGQDVSISEAVVGLIMACLAAGLFEESGKYVCLKAKSVGGNLDLAWIAKFALGYALCEAILLGVIGHAQLLYFYSSPKSMLTLGLDSTALDVMQNQVASITEWTAIFLVVERIFAIVVQIALTFLSAFAVAKKQFALLMLAILIHAFINIPAASYQYGFLELHHGEMIYALLLVAVLWILRVKGASILEFLETQFTRVPSAKHRS